MNGEWGMGNGRPPHASRFTHRSSPIAHHLFFRVAPGKFKLVSLEHVKYFTYDLVKSGFLDPRQHRVQFVADTT
jgi:hypothetical protein